MGKGKGATAQSAIRYAPYLEKIHGEFLDNEGNDKPTLSMTAIFNAALNQSPYGTYDPPPVDTAFFGTGYEIDNFPALWDMFGKFMGSMDVCDLWGEVYENVTHGPELETSVAAQSTLLKDQVDSTVMPTFLGGMRDINAVMSSAFIVGKSIIADAQVKEINKFAADLRFKAFERSVDMWSKHLDWNKMVIASYAEYFKEYYQIRNEMEKTRLDFAAKDKLWNLSLLDHARAMIGALNGAAAAKSDNTPPWMQYLGAGLSVLGTIASL